MMKTLRRRSDGAVAIRASRLAHVVDLVVRRRVELDDVERPALPDRDAGRDRRSHGSPSWRFVQLSALATIRAIDVLPVPRGPTKRSAWATWSGPDGVAERRDDRVLADDPAEGLGAPAPVEGKVGRLGGSDASGAQLRVHTTLGIGSKERTPCTLRRSGRSRAHRLERLGPGRSAAPGDDRLVLLPSGPDTVHESPLRGTRSSTSLVPAAFANGDLGRGFSPAGADCRYRAPLVPRLARPAKSTRIGQRGSESRGERHPQRQAAAHYRGARPEAIARGLRG